MGKILIPLKRLTILTILVRFMINYLDFWKLARNGNDKDGSKIIHEDKCFPSIVLNSGLDIRVGLVNL